MEHVQRMIEDLSRVLQQPMVAIRVVEQLAGEVGDADDDGAGHPVGWVELNVADAIELRVDGAEVVEVKGVVRMCVLIVAQSDQALAPIEVAVAEQLPARGRIYERSEV